MTSASIAELLGVVLRPHAELRVREPRLPGRRSVYEGRMTRAMLTACSAPGVPRRRGPARGAPLTQTPHGVCRCIFQSLLLSRYGPRFGGPAAHTCAMDCSYVARLACMPLLCFGTRSRFCKTCHHFSRFQTSV